MTWCHSVEPWQAVTGVAAPVRAAQPLKLQSAILAELGTGLFSLASLQVFQPDSDSPIVRVGQRLARLTAHMYCDNHPTEITNSLQILRRMNQAKWR